MTCRFAVPCADRTPGANALNTDVCRSHRSLQECGIRQGLCEVRLAIAFDLCNVPRQQQARLTREAVYCYLVPAGNLLLSGSGDQ
ncbi:hypothetical protein ABBQ32_005662 [Trebouxia sp. C0010 RCD-2024]